MSTVDRIRDLPDLPFAERWAEVERTWGTADPTEIIPRFVGEAVADGWASGTDITTLSDQVKLLAQSPTLDRVLEILAEKHGVRYSHRWLYNAIRAAALDAIGAGTATHKDAETEARHDVLCWAFEPIENEMKGLA